MTRDGHNKGGISPTRLSTWFSLLMESFISSMTLFIRSISLSKYGTLQVTIPLDWSPSALFSTFSFSEFCPSPRRCWRCLLTSLINSWFCYVNSAITSAMDCNCCWTVIRGAGARFGWLEVCLLSWCPGLVDINLVQTIKLFCLWKAKKWTKTFSFHFFPINGANWWCTKISRLKDFGLW